MLQRTEIIKPHSNEFLFPSTYRRACLDAIDVALRSTPAYASWRKYEIGPEFSILQRLTNLPVLRKSDMRSHTAQGFVPGGRSIEDAIASGEIELVATSGSTGDQVVNVWYQPWWDVSEKASWRLNRYARSLIDSAFPEAILTSPFCAGFPSEDKHLDFEQRRLDRFLFLSERWNPCNWTDEMMERMIDEIDAFKPRIIEANPSFLARFARYIMHGRASGTLRRTIFSPDLIVLTYESPSRLHLNQINRVFDCPVTSSYGSTESGYVFMQCEEGLFHQVTESCHVDFVPFRPDAALPGTGVIYVTTFNNPWRSLVRFDMGDVVRLSDRACRCGRSEGLTLESVEGRTISLTTRPDGRIVTQGEIDRQVSTIPGLLDYRLIQTGLLDFSVDFVAEPALSDAVNAELFLRLHSIYSAGVRIRCQQVRGIAPEFPGKYIRCKRYEPVLGDEYLDPVFSPRN